MRRTLLKSQLRVSDLHQEKQELENVIDNKDLVGIHGNDAMQIQQTMNTQFMAALST